MGLAVATLYGIPTWVDHSYSLRVGQASCRSWRWMLRHRNAIGSTIPTRLLYSARSFDEIIYRDELAALASNGTGVEVSYTLTRVQPADWTGYRRRVDNDLLREAAWTGTQHPLAYVCGPTQFVEIVAQGLLTLEYEPERVKTERFGPTGS